MRMKSWGMRSSDELRAGLTFWLRSEPLRPRRAPLSLWSPSGRSRACEEENKDDENLL